MLAPQPFHLRANGGQVAHRVEERSPLEKCAVLPEQAIDLGRIVGTQAAPEHKQMAPRHAIRGIQLKKANVPHGVKRVRGRTVEELSAYGDPPRLDRKS